MDQTFFLAANSGQGFFSLYDGFPGGGVFLHVVKGGPGTGKSGFLRRIRKAAQERGLDTETILCSGDPDSLDGLCVPALRQAWVDGTAPHVTEPSIFGVTGDYVNLGRFCRFPLAPEAQTRARELNAAYKAHYQAAYQMLAAAAQLAEGEERPDPMLAHEAEAQLREVLSVFPEQESAGCVRRRFLSAVSCRGVLHLEKTVNLLCKRIYYLRGSETMAQAAALTAERCGELIVCPDPLRPAQTEAVLAPELGIAFLTAPAGQPVPTGERALSRAALARAVDLLREAKALHDALEAVYRPYMDFEALTAYTQSYIEELFRS